MKKLIILLICGGAAFFLYTNPSVLNDLFPKKEAKTAGLIADILQFHGTVKVINIKDGVAESEVQVSEELDTILGNQGLETQSDGYIVLEFPNHSMIKVSENSRVVFTESEGIKEVFLVKGAIVIEHIVSDEIQVRVGDKIVSPNGSAFFVFSSPTKDIFFQGKSGSFSIDSKLGHKKSEIGVNEFYVSYHRGDAYPIKARGLTESPNWQLKQDIIHPVGLYKNILMVLEQEKGESPQVRAEREERMKSTFKLVEEKLTVIRQEGTSLRARINEHSKERKTYLDDISCINNKQKNCKVVKWKLLVENGWPTTETVSAKSVEQQIVFLTNLAEKEKQSIDLLTTEYNQLMREGKELQEKLIQSR